MCNPTACKCLLKQGFFRTEIPDGEFGPIVSEIAGINTIHKFKQILNKQGRCRRRVHAACGNLIPGQVYFNDHLSSGISVRFNLEAVPKAHGIAEVPKILKPGRFFLPGLVQSHAAQVFNQCLHTVWCQRRSCWHIVSDPSVCDFLILR